MRFLKIPTYIFILGICSLELTAADIDFNLISKIYQEEWGWTTESRQKAWAKIQKLGIQDSNQLLAALDAQPLSALYATWVSEEVPDKIHLKKLEQIAVDISGKFTSEKQKAFAMYILLDQDRGFENVGEILKKTKKTLHGRLLKWLVYWCNAFENPKRQWDTDDAAPFAKTILECVNVHLNDDPGDQANHDILKSSLNGIFALKNFVKERERVSLTAFYIYDLFEPTIYDPGIRKLLFKNLKGIIDSKNDAYATEIKTVWKHGDDIDKQLYLYGFYSSDVRDSILVHDLIDAEKENKKIVELDTALSKCRDFDTKQIHDEIFNLSSRKKLNINSSLFEAPKN